MAEPRPYPGAPRWVKAFGVIVLVVVLLFVILIFTRGPHGPQRHTYRRVSLVAMLPLAISTPDSLKCAGDTFEHAPCGAPDHHPALMTRESQQP